MVIVILSYVNRDPNAFFLRQSLKNSFVKPGDPRNDFSKVGHPFLSIRKSRQHVVVMDSDWTLGDFDAAVLELEQRSADSGTTSRAVVQPGSTVRIARLFGWQSVPTDGLCGHAANPH